MARQHPGSCYCCLCDFKSSSGAFPQPLGNTSGKSLISTGSKTLKMKREGTKMKKEKKNGRKNNDMQENKGKKQDEGRCENATGAERETLVGEGLKKESC